jgi:23S rRNA (pseudouridine1915-N3)-methyltransferase
MEIAILAVGRLKAGPERELCAGYLDRARKSGKALGFRDFSVRELAQSTAPRPADRIAAEEAALLAALQERGRAVCLDEKGNILDSAAFAADLGRSVVESVPRTTFVIGGPDGLGAGILGRADRRIAFGRMTWPHQVVRILLAEQLYRAMTMLSGHPYHRP